VFRVTARGGLAGVYKRIDRAWPEGIWLRATGPVTLVAELTVQTYASGFHCFETKKAARAYLHQMRPYHARKIVKVHIRDIVARGDQKGPCIVAKRLMIPL
jgi:hypothetical protein